MDEGKIMSESAEKDTLATYGALKEAARSTNIDEDARDMSEQEAAKFNADNMDIRERLDAVGGLCAGILDTLDAADPALAAKVGGKLAELMEWYDKAERRSLVLIGESLAYEYRYNTRRLKMEADSILFAAATRNALLRRACEGAKEAAP